MIKTKIKIFKQNYLDNKNIIIYGKDFCFIYRMNLQ